MASQQLQAVVDGNQKRQEREELALEMAHHVPGRPHRGGVEGGEDPQGVEADRIRHHPALVGEGLFLPRLAAQHVAQPLHGSPQRRIDGGREGFARALRKDDLADQRGARDTEGDLDAAADRVVEGRFRGERGGNAHDGGRVAGQHRPVGGRRVAQEHGREGAGPDPQGKSREEQGGRLGEGADEGERYRGADDRSGDAEEGFRHDHAGDGLGDHEGGQHGPARLGQVEREGDVEGEDGRTEGLDREHHVSPARLQHRFGSLDPGSPPRERTGRGLAWLPRA